MLAFQETNIIASNMTTKRALEASSSAPPPKRICRIVSSLPERLQDNADNDTQETVKEVSPQEYMMTTLKSMGSTVEISAALEVEGFFVAPTEEEIDAYSHDVIAAIRTRDIEKLREFHESGRPLKCSNQFGESLLHLACRRGFVDVVSFLIKEAGVTVKVIDDYGRTPLHDACWTCEPNFELLELLIKACPELLFMSDRRGNTPLEYARREHWKQYFHFLSQRQELFSSESKCIQVVG